MDEMEALQTTHLPGEVQQNDDSLPNLVPLLCKYPYRSLSFSCPITLPKRSLQGF